MREIKFRVWDKSEELMYDAPIIQPNDFVGVPVIGSDGWELEKRKWVDVIVMQYTGLKDKNGKEIYEGDIIRTHFDKTNQYGAYDEIGVVAFVSLEWKIENKKHGNYYGFYSHGEVIGNIYENPELLK